MVVIEPSELKNIRRQMANCSRSPPWYISVKEECPNGSYEVSVAFCEPDIDDVMTEGMKRILPG